MHHGQKNPRCLFNCAEAQRGEQGEKRTETDQRLPIPSPPLVTAGGDIFPLTRRRSVPSTELEILIKFCKKGPRPYRDRLRYELPPLPLATLLQIAASCTRSRKPRLSRFPPDTPNAVPSATFAHLVRFVEEQAEVGEDDPQFLPAVAVLELPQQVSGELVLAQNEEKTTVKPQVTLLQKKTAAAADKKLEAACHNRSCTCSPCCKRPPRYFAR